MKAAVRKITAYGIFVCMLSLAALLVFSDKKDFSENENRYLAKMPAFTWETVRSGAYMDVINDYLADHFPFRDAFVGARTAVLKVLGKREINGIFLTDDGSLIEDYAAPKNTERIGRIFKSFADKLDGKAEVHLMLVPTAVYVNSDKLPADAPVRNQMDTARRLYEMTGIAPIDCSGLLLQSRGKGELYYRTDHHWTTLGAYVGYQAFCGEMGFEAEPLSEWKAETVTQDFFGTLYSKANDYSLDGDSITIYTRPDDCLSVNYTDTGVVTDSLYNLEYLEKKDKYSLFLDNLHPLIEVTNENVKNGRALVLVKDSYANSIVPFLAHHYEKIYVFDTRYYKKGVAAFVEGLDCEVDVVLLYNMNTIDGDLGVGGVF